jgi:hypothetical protein
MWTIQLPLKIACDDQSRPVKHRPDWEQPYFSLNLNQYRNAHHQSLNNAKVNFEIAARKLIRAAKIPKLDRCALEYILYPRTRQLCDTNNICSIADKFFSDSLVSAGVIEDDNYNFIADSRFRFGHIDRENPRVDVIIRSPDHLTTVPPEPLTERENTLMKITTRATHVISFTSEDILNALREHLKAHITITPETNLGQLHALTDGTYELRIEQNGLVTEEGSKTRGRKPKAEPKEAMAALSQSLSDKERIKAEAAAEAAKLDSENGDSSSDLAETEPMTRVEERVIEAEAEEAANAEETTATATEEIDHSPKTELQLHLDTVKGLPEEVEARAKVEAEREALKKEKEKASVPPKVSGLFAAFQRPKN